MPTLPTFHLPQLPNKLFGVRIDTLLAYETPKVVLLRNPQLGACYFFLAVAAFCYIVLYQILYHNEHFQLFDVEGKVRATLQEPTKNGCNPNDPDCADSFAHLKDLPYCKASSSSPIEDAKEAQTGSAAPGVPPGVQMVSRSRVLSRSQLSFGQAAAAAVPGAITQQECIYRDQREMVPSYATGDTLFIPTWIEFRTEAASCKHTADAGDCTKLHTLTKKPEEKYVADVEDFTVLVAHTYYRENPANPAEHLAGNNERHQGLVEMCVDERSMSADPTLEAVEEISKMSKKMLETMIAPFNVAHECPPPLVKKVSAISFPCFYCTLTYESSEYFEQMSQLSTSVSTILEAPRRRLKTLQRVPLPCIRPGACRFRDAYAGQYEEHSANMGDNKPREVVTQVPTPEKSIYKSSAELLQLLRQRVRRWVSFIQHGVDFGDPWTRRYMEVLQQEHEERVIRQKAETAERDVAVSFLQIDSSGGRGTELRNRKAAAYLQELHPDLPETQSKDPQSSQGLGSAASAFQRARRRHFLSHVLGKAKQVQANAKLAAPRQKRTRKVAKTVRGMVKDKQHEDHETRRQGEAFTRAVAPSVESATATDVKKGTTATTTPSSAEEHRAAKKQKRMRGHRHGRRVRRWILPAVRGRHKGISPATPSPASSRKWEGSHQDNKKNKQPNNDPENKGFASTSTSALAPFGQTVSPLQSATPQTPAAKNNKSKASPPHEGKITHQASAERERHSIRPPPKKNPNYVEINLQNYDKAAVLGAGAATKQDPTSSTTLTPMVSEPETKSPHPLDADDEKSLKPKRDMYALKNGDVFSVSRLLAIAGVQLDRQKNADDEVKRRAGTLLEVVVEYRNLYPFYSTFHPKPEDSAIEYCYRIVERPVSEFKAEIYSEKQPDDFPKTRLIENQHGIYLVFRVGGSFGFLNFIYVLVMLTTSFLLLAGARAALDILAIYFLPEREMYKAAKYETAEVPSLHKYQERDGEAAAAAGDMQEGGGGSTSTRGR